MGTEGEQRERAQVQMQMRMQKYADARSSGYFEDGCPVSRG